MHVANECSATDRQIDKQNLAKKEKKSPKLSKPQNSQCTQMVWCQVSTQSYFGPMKAGEDRCNSNDKCTSKRSSSDPKHAPFMDLF